MHVRACTHSCARTCINTHTHTRAHIAGGNAAEEDSRKHKTVTRREFSAFHLQQRPHPASNHLLQGHRLTQEYMVDSYCKVEGDRVKYIYNNQNKIRADLYQGLEDAIHRGDGDLSAVGKRVVLPSSFQGGPRHMQQAYFDAMAIVRELGKPDLFITMTCNPKWSEVGKVCPLYTQVRDTQRTLLMSLRDLICVYVYSQSCCACRYLMLCFAGKFLSYTVGFKFSCRAF